MAQVSECGRASREDPPWKGARVWKVRQLITLLRRLHKAALGLLALCLSPSTPFLVLKLLMACSLGLRHRGSSRFLSSFLFFSVLFCSLPFPRRFRFMFFSPLDHLHLTAIRNPLGLTHRQHDFLADSYSSPPSSSPSAASSSSSSASSSASSSSNVYNLWQDAPDFPSPYLPALSSPALQQHHASPASGRSFHNITYQPSQDDRTNSRLVPMLPYSTTNDNDTFTRRIAVVPQPHPTLGLSSSTQHIPTTNSSADERPVRSLIFEPIYPSPSYTLSAAISSAPGSASPATYPALAPPLPPPPPSSTCSPHSSPSPSPPSSPDSKSLPAPPPPSVHAFRLDTLQSVDPSDDPCPLSLHDLMIPSEEQEYQGHSYHFSLQSLSPPRSKPQCFSEEKPPLEETNVPKRKGKSKMHTCSLCQKSFPRPSGLRTHMNSHSGDKRVSRVMF
jgi:hypothetical protein